MLKDAHMSSFFFHCYFSKYQMCSYCPTANCKWLQSQNPVRTRPPLQCSSRCGRLCSGFTLQFPGGHTQTVCFNTQGNSSFICCPGTARGMDYPSEFTNSLLSLKLRLKHVNKALLFLCTFISHVMSKNNFWFTMSFWLWNSTVDLQKIIHKF